MKIIRLNEIEGRDNLMTGGKVKFVHSDNMTVASWTFEAGSVFKEHSHPHEQILNLLGGTIDFTVDGDSQRIGAPAAIVIPPDAIHSGKTVTACTLIDVFYPVREDFVSLDK
jgi:quercetin dioxygenase-like cupin family protein